MTVTITKGDRFIVTGLYYNSTRRFKALNLESYWYAMGINLWRGHVWLLRDGKRTLLKTVYN